MKALVVVGHPAPGSFNRAIAETIRGRWSAAGREVRFHDLVEEDFDPRLTAAEARGQATADPLVRQHVAELRDSDLLAVIHPNCWGAPPAIVKGWIDYVFAPDAAYGFAKGVDQGDVPIGLLTTKAALIVNTGNTPLERECEAFGDPLERMWRDCILSYCGVRHVMRSLFGVVATSTRFHWTLIQPDLTLRRPAYAHSHARQPSRRVGDIAFVAILRDAYRACECA